jgi:hypothetical protein
MKTLLSLNHKIFILLQRSPFFCFSFTPPVSRENSCLKREAAVEQLAENTKKSSRVGQRNLTNLAEKKKSAGWQRLSG